MILKKQIGVLLLLCILISGCASAKGGGSTHGVSPALASWLSGDSGYQEALKLQKNTQEPALIYFSASWCGYCRRFERQVLSNPKVMDGLSKVLKVNLDVDQSREIADDYRISGIPKIFVRNSSGRLQAISANQSPERFLAQCATALKRTIKN